MVIIRSWITYIMLFNLIFQFVDPRVNSLPNYTIFFIIYNAVNAILFIIVVSLLFCSIIYPDNTKIANAICIASIIRYVLPFYDIEVKRENNNSV